MPFLLEAIRCIAKSHLCRGICERSKTVPVRTVNLPWQSLHTNIPACVSPPILWTLSQPQSGQVTPLGQRSASMKATAAASFVNRGLVRLQVIGNPFLMTVNLGLVFD